MLLTSSVLALLTPLVSAVAVTRRAAITDFSVSPIGFAFPPARSGFTASTAANAPCGGAAPGTRTPFPLTGGDIALTSSTNLTGVNLLWDNEANPTKFHGFNSYTNTIAKIGAGHYCTKAPDFAGLGMQAGGDVTLLMIYQLAGSQTYYYTCADISLVSTDSFSTSAKYVCGNYTTTLELSSTEDSLKMGGTAGSTSGGTTSSGSTSGSASVASGLSAAAGGGIGAGVTVAVIFALLAVAYFTGFVRVGKGQSRADAGSDTSSIPPMKQAKTPA